MTHAAPLTPSPFITAFNYAPPHEPAPPPALRTLSPEEALTILRERAHGRVIDGRDALETWYRVSYVVGDDALYAVAWRDVEVAADLPPTPIELLVDDLRDLSSWRQVRVNGRIMPLFATGCAEDRKAWRHALHLLRPRVASLHEPEASLTCTVLFRVTLDSVVGIERALDRAD